MRCCGRKAPRLCGSCMKSHEILPGPGDPGFAPAKINLALHVTGRREDGYHLIDSLVAFADIGDRLSVMPSQNLSLAVTGPFASDAPGNDRNLVLKAARHSSATGMFTLQKNLPVASGLGGGSSDAAACLRLLGSRILDCRVLGADLPVCMLAGSAHMSGIGDILVPIALPRLFALLVNPGVPVATSSVFAALGSRSNPPLTQIPPFGTAMALVDWLLDQRNDLEPPAGILEPRITVVLEELRNSGALLARMSGSGPTCFGLFASLTHASDAGRHISATHRDWWIQPCTLE